jgi:hypothetical protein
LLGTTLFKEIGSVGPNASKVSLGAMRFADTTAASVEALMFESEVRAGTNLTLGCFGTRGPFRTRGFAIGRAGTERSGAGDWDIPAGAGAAFGVVAAAVFGAAAEIPLAPRSKA